MNCAARSVGPCSLRTKNLPNSSSGTKPSTFRVNKKVFSAIKRINKITHYFQNTKIGAIFFTAIRTKIDQTEHKYNFSAEKIGHICKMRASANVFNPEMEYIKPAERAASGACEKGKKRRNEEWRKGRRRARNVLRHRAGRADGRFWPSDFRMSLSLTTFAAEATPAGRPQDGKNVYLFYGMVA